MKAIRILLSTLCVCLITPFFANAAGQINYLNIDNDAVYFSLNEDKAESSPSCVAADTAEQFAVSLRTEVGRAMYSLLITAMSSEQAVSVKSALDCVDVEGFERAKAVSIVPTISTASSGSKAMYLYKGDGVTKLGRILNTTGNINLFWYFPVDDNTQILTYHNKNWLTYKTSYSLYFKESECEGTAYIYNYGASTPYYVQNPSFNSGGLLSHQWNEYMTPQSILYANGTCAAYSASGKTSSRLAPHVDPLCGDTPCTFKEE